MSVTISGSNGIEVPAGSRITGDFSSATVANRTLFQTNVVNGATALTIVPNGNSTQSYLVLSGGSDPANAAYCYMGLSPTSFNLTSTKLGTGSYLPISFYAGGALRMSINTDGSTSVGNGASASARGVFTAFGSFGAGASSPNLALVAPGTAQSQNVGIAFAPTFTGTGDNGPRRAADIWASYSGVWGTETLSFGVGLGAGSSNDANAVTTPRMVISGDASVPSVLVVNNTMFGYGVGTGGAVVQDTSKTQAVTLNKPSMEIKLFRAAWTAGEERTFQVINSLVSQHDTFSVTFKETGIGCTWFSVGTLTSLSGGSFYIGVRNISGSALADTQITLQVNLIKGSIT